MNNTDAIKCIQKKLNEDAYYHRLTGRQITNPWYKYNVVKYRLALLYAIKALRDADNTADVLYLCDHKACFKGKTFGAHACDPCGHTRNIRHAANFDPLYDNDGRVLAYFERAQTDEDEGTKPQGVWIDHSEDYGYVECPICGHLTNCEGDVDELHYCWYCGVKLSKGGEAHD